MTFKKGDRFYRDDSRIVRDLGVLSSAILARKQLLRPLRILDACSGTGVRALRYLKEPTTDFVLANDPQTTDNALEENMKEFVDIGKALVTKDVARQCFRKSADKGHLWDLIDWDGFGAGGAPTVGEALEAVRPGGLLYVTATDSVSAAGRNNDVTIAAYGAIATRNQSVNEQMLRLVIGVAVREAAARGLTAKPVFSYFHAPSSKAQVMLRIIGQRPPSKHLAKLSFLTHCKNCLQNNTLSFSELAGSRCVSCKADPRDSFVMTGPAWTGHLHFREFLVDICEEARQRGWEDAERLIRVLQTENRFPPMYYDLGRLASKAGVVTPPRRLIQQELSKMGFSSSRSHVASRTIKTDALVPDLVEATRRASEIAKEITGMKVKTTKEMRSSAGEEGLVDEANVDARGKESQPLSVGPRR